jgi:rRNA processing protein Gar1
MNSIIIFFNHSVKLEDITIIDKDYEVEGRVSEVYFLLFLKQKNRRKYPSQTMYLFKNDKKKINA